MDKDQGTHYTEAEFLDIVNSARISRKKAKEILSIHQERNNSSFLRYHKQYVNSQIEEALRPKFGWGHFPYGTTCVIQRPGQDDPETIFVEALYRNGVDSWIIAYDNDCSGEAKYINISYVTKIIERGPGNAKISTHGPVSIHNPFKGHKDRYLMVFSLDDLIQFNCVKMLDVQDHVYDCGIIAGEVLLRGIAVRKVDRFLSPLIVDVKRFNREFKQLAARAKISKKLAARCEREMYENDYRDYASYDGEFIDAETEKENGEE